MITHFPSTATYRLPRHSVHTEALPSQVRQTGSVHCREGVEVEGREVEAWGCVVLCVRW